MKKIALPLCLLASLTFASCGGNNSSDSTTDSSKTTETTMSSDSGTSDSATAQNNETDQSADKDFVLEAANGGMMEVELGKIAEANAASPKVKEFGRMMVTDHTKANTQLKSVASQKGITIPTTLDEKHQKHVDDLKAKKGADFDKDYVDMMVDDHEEDVKKFQTEANDGKDADVKALAAKTLPVLQKHLSSIKAIQDGMKK